MEVVVTKHEKVDLDKGNMKEVTLETLRKVYKIPKDAFINEDGFLIVWQNTHGSGYDEEIREATANDKKILKVMERINEW